MNVRGTVTVQVSLLLGIAVVIPFPENSWHSKNNCANKIITSYYVFSCLKTCVLDYLIMILKTGICITHYQRPIQKWVGFLASPSLENRPNLQLILLKDYF